MGQVIAFRSRAELQRAHGGMPMRFDAHLVELAAGGADFATLLRAAEPLFDRLLTVHGCAVMQSGLPREPMALARALGVLERGLALASQTVAVRGPVASFGVYFGRGRLGWFEDGYGGETGLAVPMTASEQELADTIAARFDKRRQTRPQ